jgi:hypothetical protein
VDQAPGIPKGLDVPGFEHEDLLQVWGRALQAWTGALSNNLQLAIGAALQGEDPNGLSIRLDEFSREEAALDVRLAAHLCNLLARLVGW